MLFFFVIVIIGIVGYDFVKFWGDIIIVCKGVLLGENINKIKLNVKYLIYMIISI